MEIDSVMIVAWWGAIVATLVLLWDIVKWFTSGAKVKYRYACNIHYNDGRVISVEKINEDHTVTEYAEYCHIELINNGTSPTTIMTILATHKYKKGMKLSMGKEGFVEHFGNKLPYVLRVGEIWSCRLEMKELEKLSKYGKPEVHVSLSHKDKPHIVKIKNIKSDVSK